MGSEIVEIHGLDSTFLKMRHDGFLQVDGGIVTVNYNSHRYLRLLCFILDEF